MSEHTEVDLNSVTKKLFVELYSYAVDNPTILYRGVPLIILLYISGPMIFTVWEWGPWLWMIYGIYSKLPTGTTQSCIVNVRSLIKKLYPDTDDV